MERIQVELGLALLGYSLVSLHFRCWILCSHPVLYVEIRAHFFKNWYLVASITRTVRTAIFRPMSGNFGKKVFPISFSSRENVRYVDWSVVPNYPFRCLIGLFTFFGAVARCSLSQWRTGGGQWKPEKFGQKAEIPSVGMSVMSVIFSLFCPYK